MMVRVEARDHNHERWPETWLFPGGHHPHLHTARKVASMRRKHVWARKKGKGGVCGQKSRI